MTKEHSRDTETNVAPRADRFWKRIEKTESCWFFRGCVTKDGYGKFLERKGKTQVAHRAAWELTNGPIPPKHHINHYCSERTCVRPEHLFCAPAYAHGNRVKRRAFSDLAPSPDSSSPTES